VDDKEWDMAKAANPTNKGPESEAQGQGAKLPHHPLIKHIQEHETEPQSGTVLVGYPGPSPKAGFVRLYFQLDLRAYVEIPEDSILHHAPVEPDNEAGPMKVVVTGSAKIEVVRVLEAAFLQGSIASGYPVGNQPVSSGDPVTTPFCNLPTLIHTLPTLLTCASCACPPGHLKASPPPTHTAAHEPP
jgi:hypothetical protein